jgi:hypothetical protein
MSVHRDRSARRRPAALRAVAAAAATASCLALLIEGAALLVDRPDQVSGSHESAASQAIVRPEPGTPSPALESAQDGGRSDTGERHPGEAELVAVAGVIVAHGVDDDSLAAAMAALAIEFASTTL